MNTASRSAQPAPAASPRTLDADVHLNPAQLLADAASRETSAFDYIIVGSGAGGGPLAARLALGGRRVLLVEAGGDPATEKSVDFPRAEPGEITKIPGYHGASTEDKELSWQYSVRHYAEDSRQAKDDKYNQAVTTFDDGVNPPAPSPPSPRFLDPGSRSGVGKGGIFYPRSANIGGCTAHHAMIVVAPNDKDWNYIAQLTGDESWRAGHMRGYFAALERNRYRSDYDQFFRKLLGVFYRGYRWLVLQFDPRAILDDGGHGKNGWQPTSFIDPSLVENIAKKDRAFFDVLARTALSVLHKDRPLVRLFKKALFQLRIVQQLDYNDINTRRISPEGVFLIPTGIESVDPQTEGESLRGHRVGVREFLLQTAAKHPDRLVIRQHTHVTRVLFETDPATGVPRAIGVEFAEGQHLYEASPLQPDTPPPAKRGRLFVSARDGEVILCGGSFNTPQLLQLSGIGDTAALEKVTIDKTYKDPSFDNTPCVLRGADSLPLADADGRHRRIHLPGVGKNLQDRYEVSVISQLSDDFSTLRGVSFSPGDPNDPARLQWLKDRSGLYRTNGGTVALLRRSPSVREDDPDADTFTFGAPAAFRGYYWGWSRELFRPRRGAANDQKNLWSWIILKAYTHNHAGRVALRTQNPFHAPDICFDSFNEHAELEVKRLIAAISEARAAGRPVDHLEDQLAAARRQLDDGQRDLAALVDAVKTIREINARNASQFVEEIQPGPALPDDSDALKEWIRTQAWGHHCSCTCRIGSDAWKADTSQLTDAGAVVDSRFRVHGVTGLRIVDASVFPKIPGYFILAPVLMVAEKAADTFLNERPGAGYYPREVEAAEAAVIRARRQKANTPEPVVPAGPVDRLPKNTVGLALSGGGIRSATFALGFLQALARKGRLRHIDLMATVSGGGFIGSFLGRLFTRPSVANAADPVGRVQDTIGNTGSGPLWWLRTQANYIFASGKLDYQQNLAIFFRNLLTIHLVVATLLFAFMGLSAWLPSIFPALDLSPVHLVKQFHLDLSWWVIPAAAALIFGVLPITLAFWISPPVGSYRPYGPFWITAWVTLVVAFSGAFLIPGGGWVGGVGLAILLLTWLWQEIARIGLPLPANRLAALQATGALVRNRLTLALGEALMIFGVLAAWALLDSFAVTVARHDTIANGLALMLGMVSLALPILRWIGNRAAQQVSKQIGGGGSISTAKLLGFPLAIFLVLVLDVWAQRVAWLSPGCGWGLWAIISAFLFSLALGRAFGFLNHSSLQATYAARLTRTFQGASNEARVYASSADGSRDIRLSHPDDDISYDRYRPEENGGPLHLINVCLNETVDLASEREVRERKGLSMCISSIGVSVGRSYFTRWTAPDGFPLWQKIRRRILGVDADDDTPIERRRKLALRPVRTSSNPNAFHVLASKKSDSVEVENLSLGNWTAISGAAFTTGSGRTTSPAMSLFLGILNIRLGYWWDSGIKAHERPGRYPHSLWQRIKRLPITLFLTQSLLLSEWRGRFRGASEWFWYLSDGGHFEVTGLYELVRRRVPLMLVTDAGADPDYQWGDIGELSRQVRIDFGAQITWVDPQALPSDLPDWIRAWFNPAALGSIDTIRRDTQKHAALARVTYADAPHASACWILLVKPSISTDLPEDVRSYASTHLSFPQDPTVDQVYDDAQWESYRKLGEFIGTKVLR